MYRPSCCSAILANVQKTIMSVPQDSKPMPMEIASVTKRLFVFFFKPDQSEETKCVCAQRKPFCFLPIALRQIRSKWLHDCVFQGMNVKMGLIIIIIIIIL